MQYTKQTTTKGAWVNASELVSGDKAKLVAETIEVDTEFEGKPRKQSQSKISIEGKEDTLNVNVNKPSLNALIDAFGTESKDWINKPLTLQTEKMLIAGKRRTALYLIPEGYELREDEGGYLVIGEIEVVKEKLTGEPPEIPVIEDDPNAIDVKDIPF